MRLDPEAAALLDKPATLGARPLHELGVLRADGVATELLDWPGTIHGFLWMAGELAAGRELAARAGAALLSALR